MIHLTDTQLAEWLAGEAGQETHSHLAICAQCQTESIALKDGISRYSIAMRQQATQAQAKHLATNIAPRRSLALLRLRWVGAGTLAVLLAAQTAWLMKSRLTTEVPVPVAKVPTYGDRYQPTAQMSDDELLEAVNNDLRREVPEALAPVSAITSARNKIAASNSGQVSKRKGENDK